MKLDQHFLEDEKVLKRIIELSDLCDKDVVLEIGAGKGFLTKGLSRKVKQVIAVEVDSDFEKYLGGIGGNVEIRYGNILDMIDSLKFNKIVSNIPYSISEPLIKKIIKLDFEICVLLIGKKFYDNLFGDSKWGVIVPLFFDIEKVLDVFRDCFEPKPRVDSVVLKLKKRKKKLSEGEKIIKEFVLQDDKKVKNALVLAVMRVKGLTKKKAKEFVFNLGIPLNFFEKNVDYLSNKQFKILCGKLIF